MTLADIIAIAVVVLIIGGAAFYIIKEKKKGRRCIGCPYSDACSAKEKNSCCSCQNKKD